MTKSAARLALPDQTKPPDTSLYPARRHSVDVYSLQEGREGYFERESQERVNEAAPVATASSSSAAATACRRSADVVGTSRAYLPEHKSELLRSY